MGYKTTNTILANLYINYFITTGHTILALTSFLILIHMHFLPLSLSLLALTFDNPKMLQFTLSYIKWG